MLHVTNGLLYFWQFKVFHGVKEDLDPLLSECLLLPFFFVLCPLNLVQLTANTLVIKPKYSVISSAIQIS